MMKAEVGEQLRSDGGQYELAKSVLLESRRVVSRSERIQTDGLLGSGLRKVSLSMKIGG